MPPLRRLHHIGIIVADLDAYEDTWRMAYVGKPERIVVSLAERIG